MADAGDILDLAYKLGLYFPAIGKGYDFDGTRIHVLTFGHPAFRETVYFPVGLDMQEVANVLREPTPKMANAKREKSIPTHGEK